ncbi:MAG TPA: hypothetical protein VLB29_14805 [Nocardioidaceae bacterium]|nr:hypothetical protein [Nocardioidaceae bacterium]
MSALRPIAAIAASSLLVLLTTGAGNAGVRPGTAEGAELIKTGWWWAGNETPLDETIVAPPQSSPPNVPKGALPVSAAGGEPEKISALEFKLAGPAGGFVENATLVLRESAEPGAVVNPEGAKILACPVTEAFWADGAGASWKARPAYDCDLASASGERDAKTGVWTFDLTAVASLWTAAGSTGSTSLVLVEGVDAPESFQVAFDGPAAEGIGFAFAIGKAPATPALQPGGGLGQAGPVASGGGSGSSLTSSLGSGSGSAGPLAGTAEVASVGEPPVAGDPAVAGPATAATAPVAAPFATPAWYTGIPAVGYALLPLMLGLAYLLMLALGPDAQPATGPAQHGVARALERLRTAGSALTTKGKS